MKPWMAVIYEAPLAQVKFTGGQAGKTGVAYYNKRQDEIVARQGDMNFSMQVAYFDDEPSVDEYVKYFTTEYPTKTIIKAQSQLVVYREAGPERKGKFVNGNLLPV